MMDALELNWRAGKRTVDETKGLVNFLSLVLHDSDIDPVPVLTE